MRRFPNKQWPNLDSDEPLKIDSVTLSRPQFEHVMKSLREWMKEQAISLSPDGFITRLMDGDKKPATTASLIRMVILNVDIGKLDTKARIALHELYVRIKPDIDRTQGEIIVGEDEYEGLVKCINDCEIVKKSLVLIPFERMVRDTAQSSEVDPKAAAAQKT